MFKNFILTTFAFLMLLLVVPAPADAQSAPPPSDFFQLKKRNRTVKNYFKGSYIRFWFDNGQWVEGTIVKIARDSLWLNEQRIQLVPQGFGTVIDTVTYGAYKLHYKDIYAIPREKEGFSYIKDGTLVQIGSAGYILLNIINGLGKDSPPLFGSENGPKLAIATGVFLLGTLWHHLHRSELRIGKKYRIEYIHSN